MNSQKTLKETTTYKNSSLQIKDVVDVKYFDIKDDKEIFLGQGSTKGMGQWFFLGGPLSL